MKTKLTLGLLLISLILTSCGKTVNLNEEKEYVENRQGIIYYKGSPFSGTIDDYYNDGQLRNKINYKDGKMNGQYEWYYPNGQVRKKETYIDSRPVGKYEEYYENGQLMEKGNWKEGRRDVEYKYYENGQLRE